MAPAPTPEELIESVRRDAPTGAALDQLTTASRMVAQLSEVGDAVLDHYVDQARREGRSWAEISGILGVSKQAAHKRFATAIGGTLAEMIRSLFSASEGDLPRMERFTERTRTCLEAAPRRATELHHGYVGTEHLLLGLYAEPDSVATRILVGHGITAESVRDAIIEELGPAPDEAPASTPFTPRARKVFEEALAQALGLGHNYIGTEHFLLALYQQPDGIAAKILLDQGLDADAAAAAVAEELAR